MCLINPKYKFQKHKFTRGFCEICETNEIILLTLDCHEKHKICLQCIYNHCDYQYNNSLNKNCPWCRKQLSNDDIKTINIYAISNKLKPLINNNKPINFETRMLTIINPVVFNEQTNITDNINDLINEVVSEYNTYNENSNTSIHPNVFSEEANRIIFHQFQYSDYHHPILSDDSDDLIEDDDLPMLEDSDEIDYDDNLPVYVRDNISEALREYDNNL